jgi:hypothetical protein
MSVMYKIFRNSEIHVQNWSVQCSTKFQNAKILVQNWSVQCSTVQCERRFSRPSSSVQSREKLLDQAEVASNGELQAFRYAVLHLEDGGGGAVRGRCDLTSNRVVVFPLSGGRVEMSAETGGSSAAAPHCTSETDKRHLPKSAIPKVCRFVEEGTTKCTVMGESRTSSCFHVGA